MPAEVGGALLDVHVVADIGDHQLDGHADMDLFVDVFWMDEPERIEIDLRALESWTTEGARTQG